MSEHGDKTHCYSQFESKGAVVVGVTHVTCARARFREISLIKSDETVEFVGLLEETTRGTS